MSDRLHEVLDVRTRQATERMEAECGVFGDARAAECLCRCRALGLGNIACGTLDLGQVEVFVGELVGEVGRKSEDLLYLAQLVGVASDECEGCLDMIEDL